MAVRVAVGATAVAVSLAMCSCASRGAGSNGQSTAGIVDTFDRSGPAIQLSAQLAGGAPIQASARASASCSQTRNGTGFAFSIASSTKGYATPREAAVQFSRHNQESAPAVAAAAWTSSRSPDGYAFSSAQVAVHVTRLPNRAWIVDSGTVCR